MRVVVWNFKGEENSAQGDEELCLVNSVWGHFETMVHRKDFDQMGLATLVHIKLQLSMTGISQD